MKEKQKKQTFAVAGFLLIFSTILYLGYRQFFPGKPVAVAKTDSLNTKLPAIQQAKPLTKMELYLAAEKDSLAKQEQRSRDPYSAGKKETAEKRFTKLYSDLDKAVAPAPRNKKERVVKIPEEKIEFPEVTRQHNEPVVSHPANTSVSTDPELQQLSSMLDKLEQLQNPSKSPKVKKPDSSIVISASHDKTILAVVHQDQIIANGGMLKMRLLQDITINGIAVPRGCFVYGICQVNNERLMVQLSNISYLNQVLPFPLTVYDMDGIEGIYMPGAITRETAKEGADNALQSFQLSGLDQGLVAQAASAGLQTAKSLISRKVRAVRVTAKAGHRVFLQKSSSF